MILLDAVEYFRFVRDIPFKIPVSAHEPLYTCVGKHVVLKTLLSSLGLKVRYAFCEWRWSSLDLPKSLKALPHEDHLEHVYLEVYNKQQKRWMIVDATWDKKLGSKLPISEWDGKAIPSLQSNLRKCSEKKADNLKRPSEAQWKEYMKARGQFVEAFNRWLESIRANT